MSIRVWPVAVVLLGIIATGCARKDRPPLGKVSGTVIYNGKPLAKAAIVFYPEQDGIRSAMGATDDQGKYTLWTYDPGDGAPVGQHKVSITLLGPPEKVEMHPSAVNKAKGEAYYEQAAAQGKPLIPVKYLSPATSGLTADVKSGSNTCDFTLAGDPPK